MTDSLVLTPPSTPTPSPVVLEDCPVCDLTAATSCPACNATGHLVIRPSRRTHD